ncbi:MAG TPA: hypothetical protein VFC41_00945 [Anaerovoracaceae bacterium]|nr:hypothetical protein [Anaerovoracaceae bacterium]
MKLAIILGTRPEIIKMSPVIRECEKKKLIILFSIQDSIIECARDMMGRKRIWVNPFGDGMAGEKIVRVIRESYD